MAEEGHDQFPQALPHHASFSVTRKQQLFDVIDTYALCYGTTEDKPNTAALHKTFSQPEAGNSGEVPAVPGPCQGCRRLGTASDHKDDTIWKGYPGTFRGKQCKVQYLTYPPRRAAIFP
ncbi:hypothetical protein P7K49_026220 [Saguinus oedipus]|uniref:Uncharacterized protein n=1 Tax=Saguinus oedipus TaxID=9490 RepID=A0ABQ9UCL3_SAGOE|nr:hypothetical protein P7K49_026220 [Saguinus oedipus]